MTMPDEDRVPGSHLEPDNRDPEAPPEDAAEQAGQPIPDWRCRIGTATTTSTSGTRWSRPGSSSWTTTTADLPFSSTAVAVEV